MNRYFAIRRGLLQGALWLGLSAALGAATITTFDAPGAGTGPNQGTFARSINDAGVIAGDYIDAGNVVHGYVRVADGTFTTFDDAAPTSINAGGATTGTWGGTSGVIGSFARTAAGAIVVFGVKGARTGTGPDSGTVALSINQTGTIAGQWYDTNGVPHGFVRSPHGAITRFDVPGSTNGTEAAGINNAGTIARGWFGPPNASFSQGFVRTSSGTFTTFDVPGALATLGTAINGSGTVAGSYFTTAGSQGFVRTSDGTITTFGKTGFGAEPFSINAAGTITGILVGSGSPAFLRTHGGTITAFKVSGATGTFAYCVNSSNAVTGSYIDANGVYHGFLRTP